MTVGAMTKPTTPTNRDVEEPDRSGKAAMLRMVLPPVYLEHFTLKEYRYRWADIISADPAPSARMHHAAMTIAMRNFNAYGEAHPKVSTIASAMHVCVNTARTALKELEQNGWLHIQERKGETNLFQALLPASCEPTIIKLATRRHRDASTSPDAFAVAHQTATGLVTALGGDVNDDAAFARIRGQISSILSSAADTEVEARFVIDYVLDELPRQIENPVGLCHSRLGEYHRTFARGRTRPVPVNVDRERREFVQGVIDQLAAALGGDNAAEL